jgi:hypothetical protein
MMHKPRTFLWLVLTLPVLFVVATAVWAAEDDKPSGTVSIESTSITVGVWVNWGDGILTLNDGRSYCFSLQGLQVGSLGASKVSAEGFHALGRLLITTVVHGAYGVTAGGASLSITLSGTSSRNTWCPPRFSALAI